MELDRADALGLAGVVIHPGCYTTGTEEHGLTLVADAVRGLLKARRRGKTLVILEHTAGQGTSLGWRFEQLAAMIDRLDGDARVASAWIRATCGRPATTWGVRRDTEPPSTRSTAVSASTASASFMSTTPRSRSAAGGDRHDHIGKGTIGLEAFRRLVNDRRFADVPMLLETPKTEGRRATSVELDPLDVENLRVLRTAAALDAPPRGVTAFSI